MAEANHSDDGGCSFLACCTLLSSLFALSHSSHHVRAHFVATTTKFPNMVNVGKVYVKYVYPARLSLVVFPRHENQPDRPIVNWLEEISFHGQTLVA